jgi:hypothetical protein
MIGDNPIVIGIGILMLIYAYIFRGLEGGDGAIVVCIGFLGLAFISPVLFLIAVVGGTIYELMK